MTNSSVLLGKRKRHQLLSQHDNVQLLNDRENIINISDDESVTIPTTNTNINKNIIDNIPLIQLKETSFPELWYQIFSYLKISHLYEISMVCKTFHYIVNTHPLWYQMLETIPGLKKQLKLHNEKRNNKHNQIDAKYLITKHRSNICEACNKRGGNMDGNSILPLYIDYEHRKIRLCLTCRKKHYVDYCSNNIMEDDEFEKVYNVHENFIPKSIVEHDYLLSAKDLGSVSHIEARNPHGRGLHYLQLYHYKDVLLAAKQKYGGSIGFLAQLEHMSKKRSRKNQENDDNRKGNVLSYAESEKKKTILKNSLAIFGLHIPLGFKSVNRFIEYGFGDIHNVVDSVRELDFYNQYTDYDHWLREYLSVRNSMHSEYFKRVDSVKANKLAKKKALEGWLIKRFQQHYYQPTSLWDDTIKGIPPKSIWKDINLIWKTEFINCAISLLPTDVTHTLKRSIPKKRRTSGLAIKILKYHLNKYQIPPTRPFGRLEGEATNIGEVLCMSFGDDIYKDIAKSI